MFTDTLPASGSLTRRWMAFLGCRWFPKKLALYVFGEAR